MFWLIVKSLLSGVLVGIVSETAKRSAAFGALIASLPIVSVLGMMWLWHDTRDADRLADHAEATFWYVLPSLPMFLILPALLRRGVGFWPSLGIGCVITVALYFAMTAFGPRLGLRLPI